MRALLATMILALTLIVTPYTANAKPFHMPSEGVVLVHAMKSLGVTWQKLSNSQSVLIIKCMKGGYAGVRLSRGATVSVDLQRTTSMMNPYIGIVSITGEFEENDSSVDGSCRKTKQEAKYGAGWHANNMIYDFVIYYQMHGNELWMTGGNEVFRNNFMQQPGPPQVDANSDWLHAFRYPVYCPAGLFGHKKLLCDGRWLDEKQ